MPPAVTLHRWAGIADKARARAEIEAIFFAASATRDFPDAQLRARFLERWLLRYLQHDPDHAFVALDPTGRVTGYLVGCLDDPARAPRFDDIGYFKHFEALSARYPAHLHINVDERARGAGVGARLIERFCQQAATHGSPGVHVVTAQSSRNVGFYANNGFAPLAAIRPARDASPVQLFLGRKLV